MFEPFISTLRNRETKIQDFRHAAQAIADLMASQAVDHLSLKKISLQTPFAKTDGAILAHNIILIPILRSGIAFLPTFMRLFPNATIGFMGLKRDEQTGIAHLYYKNFPRIDADSFIIILDPTIATGGSALNTLEHVVQSGVPQERILFVAMICAQPGLDAVRKKFPHIVIITAATDPALDMNYRIIPGLGDFGDRYFGTE